MTDSVQFMYVLSHWRAEIIGALPWTFLCDAVAPGSTGPATAALSVCDSSRGKACGGEEYGFLAAEDGESESKEQRRDAEL